MKWILDRIVPAEALRWGRLDEYRTGRFHPWAFGFTFGNWIYMRGEHLAEWFLRVGPAMVAVRDHRGHPPMFSERNRSNPRAVYWHVGPYCLHAKWGRRL